MESSAIPPSEAFLVRGMAGVGGWCWGGGVCTGGDSSGSFHNRLSNHPSISWREEGAGQASNPGPAWPSAWTNQGQPAPLHQQPPSAIILISITSTITPGSTGVNKRPIIFDSPQAAPPHPKQAPPSLTASSRAPGEPSHQHLAGWIYDPAASKVRLKRFVHPELQLKVTDEIRFDTRSRVFITAGAATAAFITPEPPPSPPLILSEAEFHIEISCGLEVRIIPQAGQPKARG